MTDRSGRFADLRAAIVQAGAAGFLVPLTDEHRSEYVGAYARRLEWLTGFTGSAGAAVVLADAAALFTDGRYAIQAPAETDPQLISVQITPGATLAGWVGERLPAQADLLYDPWLHTREELEALQAVLGPDRRLRAAASNPIDRLWRDRPVPSLAPAEIHAARHAGLSSAEKRRMAARALPRGGAAAAVICALDSVAWLLNLRGRDVAYTPVVRAFCVLRSDGRAVLFVDARKLSPPVLDHLGPEVEVRAYEDLSRWLSEAAPDAVMVDPTMTVAAIYDALAGRTVIEAEDPCVWPRAIKTPVERRNAREAHRRDGAALCRFLRWVDVEGAASGADEIQAAEVLEGFRRTSNAFREPSFATIAAAGPNGALPHYVPKPGRAGRLTTGTLFLVDSGAQYDDATTDVTRTVALGTPTPEMRRHFTLALKGHLAVAMAGLPPGVTGGQLDPLARQFLWAEGLDYATGTGHGVGTCLSVHEGPVFIGRRGGTRPVDAPLAPGLLLTVEPGYYLEGAYGIRTENVYEVVEREGGWMAFEALTLAPIDRRLIEGELITPAERIWLDAYHARVLAEVGPLVGDATLSWLAQACAPL